MDALQAEAYEAMETIVRKLREFVEQGATEINFSCLIDTYDDEGNDTTIPLGQAVLDAQDAIDKARN